MNRASSLVALGVCSTALLAGCSETVMIHSTPPGANVYMDGTMVGTTPIVFTVPRSELKNRYELELTKDGYDSYLGDVHTRVAPGRATGAAFTLGIVYLFRSPYYLVAPGQIVLQRSLEAEQDRRVGQELRELKALYVEQKISEEEYEARRRRLVEGN